MTKPIIIVSPDGSSLQGNSLVSTDGKVLKEYGAADLTGIKVVSHDQWNINFLCQNLDFLKGKPKEDKPQRGRKRKRNSSMCPFCNTHLGTIKHQVHMKSCSMRPSHDGLDI